MIAARLSALVEVVYLLNFQPLKINSSVIQTPILTSVNCEVSCWIYGNYRSSIHLLTILVHVRTPCEFTPKWTLTFTRSNSYVKYKGVIHTWWRNGNSSTVVRLYQSCRCDSGWFPSLPLINRGLIVGAGPHIGKTFPKGFDKRLSPFSFSLFVTCACAIRSPTGGFRVKFPVGKIIPGKAQHVRLRC